MKKTKAMRKYILSFVLFLMIGLNFYAMDARAENSEDSTAIAHEVGSIGKNDSKSFSFSLQHNSGVVISFDAIETYGENFSFMITTKQGQQVYCQFGLTSHYKQLSYSTILPAGDYDFTVMSDSFILGFKYGINIEATRVASETDPIYYTNQEKVTLCIGDTVKLEYGVKPDTVALPNVTWVSGDTSIVSVMDDGTIKANSAGYTTIIATIGNESIKHIITVKEPVISKSKVTLYIGQKETLDINDYSGKVEWSSNDTSILSVNDGIVTAKKKGTAKVIAKIGDTYLNCTVTVKNPSLSKKNISLYLGQTEALKVNNAVGDVKWTTSDNKIAFVKNGRVMAKAKGTATLTATVSGVKLTCKITVKNPSLPQKEITVFIDKTYHLEVNGAMSKVTWSSSDKKIATVSSKGVITGKKAGKCTITAKLDDFTFSCKVTVKKAEYGNVTGCLTWQYNQYIGTKGDKGAKVMLIPVNANTKSDDNNEACYLFTGRYDNGILVTECDGYGNFDFSKVPVGDYYAVYISNNTTDSYRFEYPTKWDSAIDDLFSKYFSSKDLKTLKLHIGYNNFFREKITIEKGDTYRKLYDWGYTFI